MARGCDGLMYFRYRGATKGAEQFCYGILDADNVPRRRFYEVQDFFKTIREYEDVLSSPVKSDICILYDYDSLASFRIQKQSLLLDCETEMKRIHKVFYDANQMVDVIDASSDFSDYKIVVVPNMIITDESFLNRLKQYVKDGGCAVVTYRTAVKDRDNNLTFGKVLPVDCDDRSGRDIPVVEDEGLCEIMCGVWEGKSWESLERDYPKEYSDWKNNPESFCAPEGESMEHVYNRISSAIKNIAQKNCGKTIAVVSHGCALRNFMCSVRFGDISHLKNTDWLYE